MTANTDSANDITELLRAWTAGDQRAADQLTPLVYDELRALAKRLFRAERPGHTLQPTALVHEAYGRLINADVTWQDRAHFFALAARMMRRLLVNHAAARQRQKRGGSDVQITLDDSAGAVDAVTHELIDLDQALTALEALDPRKAELITLKFFAGLTGAEIIKVTGLSSSTIDRELRLGKAWLRVQLERGNGD
ncbi:MAG: sigma-70 family RNA polymerase sigma factor [Pseudomonadota bacterium]